MFAIDGDVIENGGNWCVTASAIRFMQSVTDNHFFGAGEQMIPCCGFYMIPSDDGKTVQICGCPNGVDFDVLHEGNGVTIRTPDDRTFLVDFTEYKNAVLSYAEQVEQFIRSSPERILKDDFDKNVYAAFQTEWYTLKTNLLTVDRFDDTVAGIDFSDYISLSENDISGVSEHGISLKDGRFIHFRECVYNYRKVNGDEGNCVGERDISSFSFTFYTVPVTTTVHFLKKSKFAELLSRKSTHQRFRELQDQIVAYGYTTRDMA